MNPAGEPSEDGRGRVWHDLGVLFAALLAIAMVGVVDFVTGTELRVYPLYMLPIAFVSWRTNLSLGLLTSLVATIAWTLSNSLAGREFGAGIMVLNVAAQMIAFTAIVYLVSYLQTSRAAERRLARVDDLTGLLNSRAFHEAAHLELNRQRRYERPMALVYLDLDNFKLVNDRFGHSEGDVVLRRVAQVLSHTTRATDVVSRLGGDEFAILLPETSASAALEISQRILHALVEAMSEHGWPVTCSIGAVIVDEVPASLDAIIGRADELMYEVKRAGRNGVRVERLVPPVSE